MAAGQRFILAFIPVLVSPRRIRSLGRGFILPLLRFHRLHTIAAQKGRVGLRPGINSARAAGVFRLAGGMLPARVEEAIQRLDALAARTAGAGLRWVWFKAFLWACGLWASFCLGWLFIWAGACLNAPRERRICLWSLLAYEEFAGVKGRATVRVLCPPVHTGRTPAAAIPRLGPRRSL